VIGGPLGPGHALVEAVEGVAGAEAVVAELLGIRLVLDEDGDLTEGSPEGVGDAGERAVDEALEGLEAAIAPIEPPRRPAPALRHRRIVPKGPPLRSRR
jgi:hypothetical protein